MPRSTNRVPVLHQSYRAVAAGGTRFDWFCTASASTISGGRRVRARTASGSPLRAAHGNAHAGSHVPRHDLMSVARLIRQRIPPAWQPPIRLLYERTRGLLERELPIVRAAVRAGDHVADVGANHGLYTHVFARRRAIVEAFEPQPECVAVLAAYAARRRSRLVRVHPVALSTASGRGTLHVPSGSASSPSASLHVARNRDAAVDVALEPLDSFELFDLALIKIDVEGAELDVLRGGRETLRRSWPLLFVEIEQRHHREPITDIFDAVTCLGYDGAFLDGGGRLQPLTAFDVDRHQHDSVLHPERGLPYVNNFLFSPSGVTGIAARRWRI
jgi:FkbM family methyltransferase